MDSQLSWLRSLKKLAVLASLTLALGLPVWAQCQMCKETASYQRAEAIQALNLGIILLAIPPAAIAGGIIWLTYRHRDGYRPPDSPNGFEKHG